MNDSTLRHTNAARAIVSAHYQTARVKDVYKSERHLALASDGDTQPGIRIGVRPALPFGGCSCSLGLTDCTCTQACENAEVDPPRDGAGICIGICIVTACILFVGAGPMVIDWLKGVL